MIFRTIIFLLSAFSVCFGEDVVFIGLSGENAPAVEKTYDRLLRERLSVMPGIKAVDYLQTQRYREQINFEDYPTVSRVLVESLNKLVSDTTLFVWGTVKEYRISAIRKNLIGSALKGELTIGLNIYNSAHQTYAYAGNVKASVSKSKGLIFFSRLDRAVHISALDRTEMLEELESKAVANSARMISAITKIVEKGTRTADVEQYKVPSLSDVFSVPSMEAPTVKQESPDSTHAGSKANSQKTDLSKALKK